MIKLISVIIDYENENEITDKLVIIKDKNDEIDNVERWWAN